MASVKRISAHRRDLSWPVDPAAAPPKRVKDYQSSLAFIPQKPDNTPQLRPEETDRENCASARYTVDRFGAREKEKSAVK